MQEFIEIDGLLNNDPASIDAGMKRFHALVTGRANWLLDNALEAIPGAELFSADAAIDPSDPSTRRWTDWPRSWASAAASSAGAASANPPTASLSMAGS